MRESASDRERALDEIRRTYRRYGERGRHRLWDRANPGYSRIARDRDRRLVELVRGFHRPGGSILDVGCGPGNLADLVRAAVGDVAWTGVDLLPEAVEVARRERPWATWLEESVDRLPFKDGSFQIVVASTLFSSLPSRKLADDAAAEVGRVLRQDGWLVWYDLRYANPGNLDVHGIDVEALARLFPGWVSELRSITLLPPIARRLGPLTPALYPRLESIPLLRSHLIGTLRRASIG